MSDTEIFGKRHTEFALTLFCRSAVKVLVEEGFKDTPSEEQLYDLIMRDVFGDDKHSLPNNSRDNASEEHVRQVDVEVLKEDNEEIEHNVAKPLKKVNNLSSKDLKKNPLKIVQKNINEDGAEVEVELVVEVPYLSEIDYSQTCQSLKVNGGLFTPCLTRPTKDSAFCKTCVKANHKYGTMEQRSNCAMLCYEDPSKKKEISFGTWLKKRGVERVEVESKLNEQYGITLPEEYWSIDKSKASRAMKKTVSTSSDDEVSLECDKIVAPKKRGRPAKSAKKVSSSEDHEASVGEASVGDDESVLNKSEVSSKDVETKTSDELMEEPYIVSEPTKNTEQESDEDPGFIEKKNGSVKKLDSDHHLVFWDNKTYIIDLDDNCVWTHDDDYEIVTCVGEWCPDSKTVSIDED